MVKKYTTKKGDLIWLNFTPQTGDEQLGKRPALRDRYYAAALSPQCAEGRA